jgi:RHS repeat-associated protein
MEVVVNTVTGPSTSSSSSFTYDEVGNTTQRTTPDKGQQSLTWSDAGQLTAVTDASGGSSYIYDAAGQLLLQKNPTTTTLYLPGQQLVLNTATKALTGTRYYALPGGGQAVRTGTASNYTFQTGDPHGTADLTINPAFTTSTWRQQTPYGAPRGTTPTTWPDNHGFLGKPQDTTTGLTDIGARWYDPINGRFASLDPVFQPTDPGLQNGYTYTASNPISQADPTGLCPYSHQLFGEGPCGAHDENPHNVGGGPNSYPDACQYNCTPKQTRQNRATADAQERFQQELERRRKALADKIASATARSAYMRDGAPTPAQAYMSFEPWASYGSGGGENLLQQTIDALILDDASQCASTKSGSALDCLAFYSKLHTGSSRDQSRRKAR